MKLTKFEKRDVRAVFGDKGMAIVDKLTYEIGDKNQVTLGDGPLFEVSMELREDAGPFQRIHEVAHVYHCTYWPSITDEAPNYRAEACALLAEVSLRAWKYNGLTDAAGQQRIAEWTDLATRIPDLAKAVVVADRVQKLPNLSIHEKMGKVINGECG